MALVYLLLLVLLSNLDLLNNVVDAGKSGGGCGKPNPPSNGNLEFFDGECVVTCDPGYKFRDGSKNVSLECINGKWMVHQEIEWNNKYTCEHAANTHNGRHKFGRRSKSDKAPASKKFCKEKLEDKRFAGCKDKFEFQEVLIDACSWSYCYCDQKNAEDCACDRIASFVNYCTERGGPSLTNWRDEKFCPIKCTGGRVPMKCAQKEERACGSTPIVSDTNCTEGCACPEGSVIYKDKCIKEDKCPCLYDGKSHESGKKVEQGCNNCICKKGHWDCTPFECKAVTCSAVGDPHYTTFDGRKFNFMGNCSYHLVQTADFDIIGENGPLKPKNYKPGDVTYTKSVIVKAEDHEIKLNQGPSVTVDNKSVTKFPYTVSGIIIRHPSAKLIKVILPSGTTISWNGAYRVHVTLPGTYSGKTTGLCANFNNKADDDFTKPDGTKAKNENDFGNSWKTIESCPVSPPFVDPCKDNPKNKKIAETECKKLKSDIFKGCHNLVKPDSYYDDCVVDSCACDDDISPCLCPMVDAYADACRSKGVVIDWRKNFAQCPMNCTDKQTEYQTCASPCDRTCLDISTGGVCAAECVEDCRCPKGQAFDENGTCVPINKCGCPHNGKIYPDGRELIRSGQICTCMNAMWICDNNTCNVEDEKAPIDCNSCTCKKGQWASCTNEICPDGCEVKNQNAQTEILKDGESRDDGPCKSCTCTNDPKTGHLLVCTTQNCLPPDLDLVNFVYQNETKAGECCPTFVEIGCKYNDKAYTENQSWDISKCKKGICVKNGDGKFTKREITQACGEIKCGQGFKLEQTNNTCCPKCTQYACILEDGIKNLNDTWKSDDGCITSTCAFANGEFVVYEDATECPKITQCPAGKIVIKGCCRTCNTE